MKTDTMAMPYDKSVSETNEPEQKRGDWFWRIQASSRASSLIRPYRITIDPVGFITKARDSRRCLIERARNESSRSIAPLERNYRAPEGFSWCLRARASDPRSQNILPLSLPLSFDSDSTSRPKKERDRERREGGEGRRRDKEKRTQWRKKGGGEKEKEHFPRVGFKSEESVDCETVLKQRLETTKGNN